MSIGRPRTVTDRELLDAWRKHDTQEEIGRAVGLSQTGVGYRLRQLGIRTNGAITPRNLDAARAVKEHGTQRAAAATLGVAQQTISAHMRRFGAHRGNEPSVPASLTTKEASIATGIEKRTLLRIAHAIGPLRDRLVLPSPGPPYKPLVWSWQDAMLARLVSDLRRYLSQRQIAASEHALGHDIIAALNDPAEPIQFALPLDDGNLIAASVLVTWDAPTASLQMRAQLLGAPAKARQKRRAD